MKRFHRYTTVIVAVFLLSTSVVVGQHHPRFDTIRERIKTRDYPSVFSTWAGFTWRRVLNRPNLTGLEVLTLHDIYWTHSFTGVRWHYIEDTYTLELKGVVPSDIPKAERLQREMETINPNMVYLMEIRMKTASPHRYPPADSLYWVHDADGNRVGGDRYLVDFVKPEVQDMIVQQAINVVESGFFDGIMFDWWVEGFSILEGYGNATEEQVARDNILRRIREVTPPDFLIIINTNDRFTPNAAPYVNGAFMETSYPYPVSELINIEQVLQTAESTFREPQVNCLESRVPESWDLDSPISRQWMRLFTAMSLTLSDGAVLHAQLPGHSHNWYEFWDADLGTPISATSRLYKNIDGCFIREFTNGYAVYNRSSENLFIEFSDAVAGVSSKKIDFVHELPHLDGEIYLKSSPTHVNTRDLLTTQWGMLKSQ